jgi:hypothetical protein
MYYTIYRITNKLNGRIYIGKHQTTDLDDNYMGSGKVLRRALCRYGKENFNKEILHVFDTEAEMNAKEEELVTEEFCRGHTYNLKPGGRGGFALIDQKAGQRAAVERLKVLRRESPEYRQLRREKGQKCFEASLKKWKEANPGATRKSFTLDGVDYDSIRDYAAKQGIHVSAAHQRVHRKSRDVVWK